MKDTARFQPKQRPIVVGTILAGMLSLSAGLQAAQPPSSAWLWLSSTEHSCSWTVTVTWAGFSRARTLEAFVTATYTGVPLVPARMPIDGKSGIATIEVGPLPPGTTPTAFYTWAHLLDAHGNPIPASLDFAGVSTAYCAAP